jgi:MYXO-CTERM domain-containing protein
VQYSQPQAAPPNIVAVRPPTAGRTGRDGLTGSSRTVDPREVRQRIAWLTVAVLGCQAAPDESTTEQAVIVMQPSSRDFGTQQIGTTSGGFEVTVSPGAGNQDDTITAVTANCPDFVVSAQGLPAQVFRVCEVITCTNRICPIAEAICQTTDLQTYAFDTAFRPTVAGTVSCVVNVTTANAANSRTVTLTGTGLAPPISVDVQPGSIGFGDVRRGTDSTRATLSVRSTGGQALTVSSVTVSGEFIMSGDNGAYQLPPNAVQSYEVACRPTTVGSKAGQIVVTSNDPLRPQVTVPLSCKGVDSNLDIAPSPAVLRTTRVGEPIDAMIDLRNSGGAAMVLESVAIQSSGLTMTTVPAPGTMLAAMTGVAQVGIHFDASAKGDVTGTLVATYDGGQTRSTEITARALATSMALTPDGEIDFGPVCAGESRMQQFTLMANEQGSFSLRTVSDPGAPFAVETPILPLAVQGAGANQVRFQVTAAPVAEGVVVMPVTLTTDIPKATDHTLTLRVQGLPAGVTATPESIDLGSLPINTTTIGQAAQLSNCGTAPIAFSNPRIEGIDAADFAIVQQPTSPTIAPAGMASWLIVLQAHSVGPKQATFAVDHDGGTASVPLLGEGLGDIVDVGGRGSYYACSTGDASSPWPLAIGLALIWRRRRRRR